MQGDDVRPVWFLRGRAGGYDALELADLLDRIAAALTPVGLADR